MSYTQKKRNRICHIYKDLNKTLYLHFKDKIYNISLNESKMLSRTNTGTTEPLLSTVLVIKSFNILAPVWVKPEWFPDVSKDLLDIKNRRERYMSCILADDPDIICLQEVTASELVYIRSTLENTHIISELAANNPTSASEDNGTATLIRKSNYLCNPRWSIKKWYEYGNMSMILDIDFYETSNGPIKPLTIINTHLEFDPDGFDKEASAIMSFWTSRNTSNLMKSMPIKTFIWCGDFNQTPKDKTMTPIKESFSDLFNYESKNHSTYTFGAKYDEGLFNKRVDYILVANNLMV